MTNLLHHVLRIAIRVLDAGYPDWLEPNAFALLTICHALAHFADHFDWLTN